MTLEGQGASENRNPIIIAIGQRDRVTRCALSFSQQRRKVLAGRPLQRASLHGEKKNKQQSP